MLIQNLIDNRPMLGADAGVTHGTAKSWLSVLEAGYIAWRLPPFHANVSKRLIKTPKLHFVDSGLACYLLGIHSPGQLRDHPLRGAIFETWVASEILKSRTHRGLSPSLSFFRGRFLGRPGDLHVGRRIIEAAAQGAWLRRVRRRRASAPIRRHGRSVVTARPL